MLLKNNRHICSRMGREFKKHCKTWKLNSVCDYLYHNYITHDNSTTTQSYKSSGLTRYLWLTSRYTSLTRRWLDFIVNQAGIRHSLVDDWTSLSTNFYIVIQLLPISSLSLKLPYDGRPAPTPAFLCIVYLRICFTSYPSTLSSWARISLRNPRGLKQLYSIILMPQRRGSASPNDGNDSTTFPGSSFPKMRRGSRNGRCWWRATSFETSFCAGRQKTSLKLMTWTHWKTYVHFIPLSLNL